MTMIEHHIQQEIVNRLVFNASLRFSELKPDGMESNIFMYHLKQLQQAGFVIKDGAGYSLGIQGLQYADSLSTANSKPRKQPKLIAILALQGPDGRWLLARRRCQPYIGSRMFPSGKQHFGETVTQHADREVLEKIGLPVALVYQGVAEILIHQDGELLTQVQAHVHHGSLPTTELPQSSMKFEYVWHDFNGTTEPVMAGTTELYTALQQHAADRPFMIELLV